MNRRPPFSARFAIRRHTATSVSATVVWLFIFAVSAGAAALHWETGEGYRVAKLPALPSAKPGFTLVPISTTGIAFTNTLSQDRIMANANLLNGSGVALGDYDGDGLCDVYLCNLNGTNALYRNLGDWKFVDVTEAAGVACPGQTSTGAVFADINGDGYLDLLVTSMGGPNACFLNDGHGHFTNITAAAGLTSKLGSTSMALADIDGNGTLDLYVANYGATSLLRSGGALAFRIVGGKPVVSGRNAKRIKIIDGVMFELGEPDVLYLNNGQGQFTPVSWTDGSFLDENGKPLAEAPWDQGLTVLFRDFNGDGAPDIYVCNDASTPDRFWINDGHGRFRAQSSLAQRQTSYFSMSADTADLARDGSVDLLVLDMLSRNHARRLRQMSQMHAQRRRIGEIANQLQFRHNTLFHSRGDDTYAEIGQFSGVDASEWSWSVVFLDVDLDGWEDALIANGFAYDMDDLDTRELVRSQGQVSVAQSRRSILLYPRLETPNAAFRNQHDLTFEEVGQQWGWNSAQVCNGMAVADLDNDGDLDIVVNCLNQPALLYRNDCSAPRLGVRLKGKAPNTQGIGAKIKVLGGPVIQTEEVICGGRYVSGDDPMRVFATGQATHLMIEVTWRSGNKSVIERAQPNCIYELDESFAKPASVTKPANAVTFFQDVSNQLQHTHYEEPYDDSTRQPLLPKLLSQPGPGLAWFDWNGDGYDDLIIGTGRGGTLAVFINNRQGGFNRLDAQALRSPAPDDLGGIVAFSSGTQERTILAALGNYESSTTNGAAVLRYDREADGVRQSKSVTAFPSCTGPMALGDMDGTGQLELFVGGRVLPGRYPEAAASRLYRNHAGQFVLDQASSRALEKLGLVNGAVFSDLSGTGRADLILACDWGPIRVFAREAGQLKEITEKLGLGSYLGWWNGVATGDFDGDGKLDIIASNWGRNTKYEHHRTRPLRLYYGDLDGNGTVDVLEAYFEPALGKYAPERLLDVISPGLPLLRDHFKTHRAYGQAGIEDCMGALPCPAKVLEANWLETTLFLNRGDHFETRPLPPEAQFAPAFGVSVGDLDGDGNEDVFLAQNFFATPPDTARYDAGRSLWLKGDGKGNFVPVSGQESGLTVYGEQRGCALADYDGDGRVDLAVTQNGAATKLYHNVGGKPGLRVRLHGPTGNPDGIGAALRLFFGEKAGPVREVHAGSGYWSQDSSLQVLATPEPPTQLWVRWPGGKVVTKEVPPRAREIEISAR